MTNSIAKTLSETPRVREWWILINKKYKRSLALSIFLNLSVFVLSALLILMNLWALLNVKYNHPHGWQWKFLLAMAIITSLSGLITSFLVIFKFKVKARSTKEAISEIKQEYEKYQKGIGKYSKAKFKDQILLEKVSNMSFIEL